MSAGDKIPLSGFAVSSGELCRTQRRTGNRPHPDVVVGVAGVDIDQQPPGNRLDGRGIGVLPGPREAEHLVHRAARTSPVGPVPVQTGSGQSEEDVGAGTVVDAQQVRGMGQGDLRRGMHHVLRRRRRAARTGPVGTHHDAVPVAEQHGGGAVPVPAGKRLIEGRPAMAVRGEPVGRPAVQLREPVRGGPAQAAAQQLGEQRTVPVPARLTGNLDRERTAPDKVTRRPTPDDAARRAPRRARRSRARDRARRHRGGAARSAWSSPRRRSRWSQTRRPRARASPAVARRRAARGRGRQVVARRRSPQRPSASRRGRRRARPADRSVVARHRVPRRAVASALARGLAAGAPPRLVCFAGHDAGVFAAERPAGMVLRAQPVGDQPRSRRGGLARGRRRRGQRCRRTRGAAA